MQVPTVCERCRVPLVKRYEPWMRETVIWCASRECNFDVMRISDSFLRDVIPEIGGEVAKQLNKLMVRERSPG